MGISQIQRSQVGVLLIDAQPLFWNQAFGGDEALAEPVLARLERLLMVADWMTLPVIATFEHPVAENGQLPDRLEAVFPADGQRYTKRTYNCCLEPTVRDAVRRLPQQQFAIAGAETDVCILQSTLGLLRLGYEVFVLEDCLFTSEPHPRPALRRMYQAGAIPATFKSFAYELAETVDHTPWLPTWIDRGQTYTRPFPEQFGTPEELPPWQPA